MRLGERFKQVVAANFIEIGKRDGESPTPTIAPPPSEATTRNSNNPSNWRRENTSLAAAVEPAVSVETAALIEPVASAGSEQPAPEIAVEVFDPTNAAHWFRDDGTAEYDGILATDGAPDFSRLFNNADLPEVSCNAEGAAKILADMPQDLPMRVRRITARATVDRLCKANPAALGDILSDASLKMVQVARFEEKVVARANGLTETIGAEIAALEAQVAALRAEAAEIEARRDTAQKACRNLLGELHNVVLFFDHSEVTGAVSLAGAVEVLPDKRDENAPHEELPPFLRDDAVMRMLGLQEGGTGDTADEGTSVDTSEVAPEPRRNGATRRKTANVAAAPDSE